jgi:dihydrodipicolinate synthase/N-acetylneuraminate lyase
LESLLSGLIELQLRNSVKGFFTLGTCNEGLLLPVKKRMLVLDIIAENISSDFLIINIVYALSIKDNVKLIKRSIDIIALYRH